MKHFKCNIFFPIQRIFDIECIFRSGHFSISMFSVSSSWSWDLLTRIVGGGTGEATSRGNPRGGIKFNTKTLFGKTSMLDLSPQPLPLTSNKMNLFIWPSTVFCVLVLWPTLTFPNRVEYRPSMLTQYQRTCLISNLFKKPLNLSTIRFKQMCYGLRVLGRRVWYIPMVITTHGNFVKLF